MTKRTPSSPEAVSRKAFLGLMGGAALMPLAAPVAVAQSNAPLRVGFIVGIESIPMYVMQARAAEIEARLGFPVRWMPYLNTGDQLNAFRTGAMDVVESGISALATLHMEGFPIRMVRGYHYVSFKLLAHKDSPIARIEDLRGRTVGVTSLAGTSYVATAVALRASGMDPRADVQVITAAATNLIASLETRRLDAATLWDPFVSQALRSGNLKVVLDLRDVYRRRFNENFMQTGVAVPAPAFEANRARIQRFLAELTAAIEFTVASPTEANALAATSGRETLRLTVEEIAEARRGFEDAWVREEIGPTMLTEVQSAFDRMQELGVFRQRVDVASFWTRP
jgi:ABC-type nitrate/sulfonate/bicarbonate transport system substrate-binding protein